MSSEPAMRGSSTVAPASSGVDGTTWRCSMPLGIAAVGERQLAREALVDVRD